MKRETFKASLAFRPTTGLPLMSIMLPASMVRNVLFAEVATSRRLFKSFRSSSPSITKISVPSDEIVPLNIRESVNEYKLSSSAYCKPRPSTSSVTAITVSLNRSTS